MQIPAQPLTTAEEELDHLDHKLPEVYMSPSHMREQKKTDNVDADGDAPADTAVIIARTLTPSIPLSLRYL